MSIKFLIVDDSVTMRRIVVNSLISLGYENFVEANDGKEALEKLAADEDLNFVITDWNMPVSSGFDLTKSIRQDARLAKVPILMVTTRSADTDIIEALQLRVNNYITKPFTPHSLKEKIEMILAARELEKNSLK